jgi:CDP-diacylglycerol--glycerol-3-phosphate 3-phosphatidyltransferase
VPLLSTWLRALWFVARRLRPVPPTVITVLGVVLAVDAVLLAGRHPGWAAGAVVLSAVSDGLDGAVAVVADRATRSGAVADGIADRVADLAFAAVLWRLGVPWPLALGCGALAVGVDGLRRLRRVPDRITVGERPSWTICAALAGVCAAVTDAHWPIVVCAGVWALLGVLALGQLAGARPVR